MTVYYIDYAHGLDTPVATNAAWGQKTATLTIDSVPDTTHFIDAALTGADNYINNAFVWNITKGQGRYVDAFDSGSDRAQVTVAMSPTWEAGDEYYMIYAYKTIAGYTVPARTAGDKAYVRAGTTETVGAAITHTTDGTYSAYLSVIGMGTGTATLETTDATETEAWHDASTVRPILDFGGNAYYISINGDDYWEYKNIDFYRTNSSTAGEINIVNSSSIIFTNCIIRDSMNSSGAGVWIQTTAGNALFTDCQFTNNDGYNVRLELDGRSARFIRCTFDSGAETTTTGLSCASVSNAYLEDCKFGVTSAHGTNDLVLGSNCKVIARNCVWNTAHSITGYGSVISSEDDDGVFGAQVITKVIGTVSRDVTADVPRTGGATSVAKMIPTTYASSLYPLTISGELYIPDFRLWLAAGAHTITVYISGFGWASFPTAAQLWVSAEYITDDTTGAITRTTAVSTAVLTANYVDIDTQNYVAFPVSVDCHVASFVNVKVYLALYEDAATGVYVDVKPVIS